MAAVVAGGAAVVVGDAKAVDLHVSGADKTSPAALTHWLFELQVSWRVVLPVPDAKMVDADAMVAVEVGSGAVHVNAKLITLLTEDVTAVRKATVSLPDDAVVATLGLQFNDATGPTGTDGASVVKAEPAVPVTTEHATVDITSLARCQTPLAVHVRLMSTTPYIDVSVWLSEFRLRVALSAVEDPLQVSSATLHPDRAL